MINMHSKKPARYLLAMIMVFALLAANICSIAYAADNTGTDSTYVTAGAPAFGSEPADPAKAPPLKSILRNNAATGPADLYLKSDTDSAKAGAAARAGEVPSFIHYELLPNPNYDLRTIKFTVSLVNCYTPVTNFEGYINIYNYNGTCTSSTRVWGSMFYSYTWTLTIPITSTVEETIIFSGGTITQALKDYANLTLKDYRTNQIGGSYNSILTAMGG